MGAFSTATIAKKKVPTAVNGKKLTQAQMEARYGKKVDAQYLKGDTAKTATSMLGNKTYRRNSAEVRSAGGRDVVVYGSGNGSSKWLGGGAIGSADSALSTATKTFMARLKKTHNIV